MTTATRPLPDTNAEASAAAARPSFDWLFVVSVLAVIGAYVRVIVYTPPEAIQGLAQKIYYLHVPAAVNAYVAFGVVAVCSLVYLWLRDERADRLAESAAEVGLLYTTVVLITGPLWGKPIWGTWWTWDMRLTLTLFLWFIYAAYMVLRGAIDDRAMRARYAAVLGVLGALLIPFIHMSVYLFNTLHPMPIVLKPDKPSLPGNMLLTLALSFLAFLLLNIALIRARYRYALKRDALEALHDERSGGGE